MFETIRSSDPDLIAIQEPTPRTWAELTAALGDRWIGLYGDRLDTRYPDSHGEALLYRWDRFSLLRGEIFWISATPDVPGSVLEPNQWGQRITVAASLRDRRAGGELVFGSVHFDTHPDAWLPSARIVAAELTRRAAGRPLIFGGDFNCAAGSPGWRHFREAGFTDPWTASGQPDDGVITFNMFKPVPRHPVEDLAAFRTSVEAKYSGDRWDAHYGPHVLAHRNERIDWLLYRGPWRTTAAAVDTRLWNGRCASDHFAITADLSPL